MNSTHTRRHTVAEHLFAAIDRADSTKELDTMLTQAHHHFAADVISTGTVEALALRCRYKARALWIAAGCPEAPAPHSAQAVEAAENNQSPTPTDEQSEFQAQRREWKKNLLRRNSGIDNTTAILR